MQSHAHPQTWTKTAAKFQKDLGKIVGGVALTIQCILSAYIH